MPEEALPPSQRLAQSALCQALALLQLHRAQPLEADGDDATVGPRGLWQVGRPRQTHNNNIVSQFHNTKLVPKITVRGLVCHLAGAVLFCVTCDHKKRSLGEVKKTVLVED